MAIGVQVDVYDHLPLNIRVAQLDRLAKLLQTLLRHILMMTLYLTNFSIY